MIMKIRNVFQHKRNEHGSDLVVTLFMIPIFIAVLFSIIEVSTYFQTKTQVENIARDGARMVALFGGSSANISLNQDKFGGQGKAVTAYVYSRLVDVNGNCTISGCKQPPVVTCGPSVASALNQDAFCTIDYYYSGVAGSIVNWIGFNAITDNPIHATATFKVETAW